MAAMKRSAMAPMRRVARSRRPTAKDLFTWAASREATVADAARHFRCTQSDIRDAIDAFDNGEGVPGAYLGLGVAKGIGSGTYELKGGRQLVEAYYAPDDKEARE